jgi:hypothetical protein
MVLKSTPCYHELILNSNRPIVSQSSGQVSIRDTQTSKVGEVYCTTRLRPRSNDTRGPNPLLVILEDGVNQPLPPDAQINYAQTCEIGHDTRIINVGMVHPEHHRNLLRDSGIAHELEFWQDDLWEYR